MFFENQGTTTAIEKNDEENEDEIDEMEKENIKTSLQILMNGMTDKKNIICILILDKRKIKRY